MSQRDEVQVSLMHTSFWKNSTLSSWVVCFCIVRGFEEEVSIKNLHSVLLCLMKKHSDEPFERFLTFNSHQYT